MSLQKAMVSCRSRSEQPVANNRVRLKADVRIIAALRINPRERKYDLIYNGLAFEANLLVLGLFYNRIAVCVPSLMPESLSESLPKDIVLRSG